MSKPLRNVCKNPNGEGYLRFITKKTLARKAYERPDNTLPLAVMEEASVRFCKELSRAISAGKAVRISRVCDFVPVRRPTKGQWQKNPKLKTRGTKIYFRVVFSRKVRDDLNKTRRETEGSNDGK